MKIQILRVAEKDLNEAVVYYEEIQAGLRNLDVCVLLRQNSLLLVLSLDVLNLPDAFIA